MNRYIYETRTARGEYWLPCNRPDVFAAALLATDGDMVAAEEIVRGVEEGSVYTAPTFCQYQAICIMQEVLIL